MLIDFNRSRRLLEANFKQELQHDFPEQDCHTIEKWVRNKVLNTLAVDVKKVVVNLYSFITRERFHDQFPRLDGLCERIGGISRCEDWKQHPDIKLDRPATEFYSVLRQWVEKRQAYCEQVTEGSEQIMWPRFPEELTEVSRLQASNQGRKILNWQRPKREQLQRDECLLANGKVISAQEWASFAQSGERQLEGEAAEITRKKRKREQPASNSRRNASIQAREKSR